MCEFKLIKFFYLPKKKRSNRSEKEQGNVNTQSLPHKNVEMKIVIIVKKREKPFITKFLRVFIFASLA